MRSNKGLHCAFCRLCLRRLSRRVRPVRPHAISYYCTLTSTSLILAIVLWKIVRVFMIFEPSWQRPCVCKYMALTCNRFSGNGREVSLSCVIYFAIYESSGGSIQYHRNICLSILKCMHSCLSVGMSLLLAGIVTHSRDDGGDGGHGFPRPHPSAARCVPSSLDPASTMMCRASKCVSLHACLNNLDIVVVKRSSIQSCGDTS